MASGFRNRRSNAHASAVAVVSWPGEQERHELVADLRVAHRLAVLEPGGDEQGENVVARTEVGGGLALRDLLVQDRVRLVEHRLEATVRTEATEAVPRGRSPGRAVS